jgi:hypothetical protein
MSVPERNESIAKPQIPEMARVRLKFETRDIGLVTNSAVHRDRQSEIKSVPQRKDCGSDLEPGHRSNWLTESIVLGSGRVDVAELPECDRANADLCAAEH